MAPVVVDPKRIRELATEKAFNRWLSKHHGKDTSRSSCRAERVGQQARYGAQLGGVLSLPVQSQVP